MRTLIIISLVWCSQHLAAQSQQTKDLYANEVARGKELLRNHHYDDAIGVLTLALTLPDRPAHDNLDSIIQVALQERIDVLDAALTKSRRDSIIADSLHRIDSSRQQVLIANQDSLLQLAKVAEVIRLRLLSGQQLALGDLEGNQRALFLAYHATQILPDSVSLLALDAFGNAVYRDLSVSFVAGDTLSHFGYMSDSVAIVAAGGKVLRASDKGPPQHLFTHSQPLRGLRTYPRQKLALTWSDDHTAALIRDGAHQLLPHGGEVTHAIMTKHRTKIITCSRDNTVKLWDLEGNELETLHGHQGNVYEVMSVGDRIITRGSDARVMVWTDSGDSLFSIHRPPYIYDADLSPDGSQLALASADGTAEIWDLHGRRRHRLTGHTAAIRHIEFGPKGKQVMTWGLDDMIRIWEGGERVAQRQVPFGIELATFTPDGSGIFLSSVDQSAGIWRPSLDSMKYLEQTQRMLEVKFSPDEQAMLTTSADGRSQLWDLEGNVLMRLDQMDSTIPPRFSADGRSILSAWGVDYLLLTPMPDYGLELIKTEHPNLTDPNRYADTPEHKVNYFDNADRSTAQGQTLGEKPSNNN